MNNPLYKMMISNLQNYFKGLSEGDKLTGKHYNAFVASDILAIALAKVPEDIMSDILGKGLPSRDDVI